MQNKVIVITGASAGIGAALAERLGAEGASLVLVARRENVLRDVASRSGAHVLPVVADVTVHDDVRRVAKAAIERFGHIDVWISNAGQGITRQPSELTDEDIDLMIRVNVKSVLYGIQEVLPHFKERGTGHVINISSELGRVPYAVHRSAYSGSKHFMNALTANFRDEVQQTHPEIQFSIVSPGVVKTEFGVRARHGGPDSRQFAQAQSADEVAAVIAEVIVSRRRDAYTRPDAHKRVVDYYAGLLNQARIRMTMTLADFRRTFESHTPPPGMAPALVALWHDGRGDWHAAHNVAQDIEGSTGAWIHAYLHRKEGDLGNAGYWYARASKPAAKGSLEEEWEAIAVTLLKD